LVFYHFFHSFLFIFFINFSLLLNIAESKFFSTVLHIDKLVPKTLQTVDNNVFISFHQRDSAIVTKLKERLEKKFAYKVELVNSEDNFNRLPYSGALLVCFSEAYEKGGQCRLESYLAEKTNQKYDPKKPFIIPVNVDNNPYECEYWLSKFADHRQKYMLKEKKFNSDVSKINKAIKTNSDVKSQKSRTCTIL
jgi:hypothetical protein